MGGIYIIAACNNKALHSLLEVNKALFIYTAQVASKKPFCAVFIITESFFVFLLILQVAEHNCGT